MTAIESFKNDLQAAYEEYMEDTLTLPEEVPMNLSVLLEYEEEIERQMQVDSILGDW